ncbi:MAG: DEAD/DEAH box helicase [Muribaculaceae bacterium]|nr:DEAD/DEAH box helicase [Muribaculaceae bacterium]
MAKRFDELLTNDDVLDGLWDMHFDECTPIQEQTIPIVLDGRDLLACAQTGTGKTAAYLLPVIDRLAEGGFPEDAINCIVMAPTRELAQQIDRQLQGFAYFMPVSSIAIYGGTDGYTYEQQRKGLKMGADVVIATPGRLLAHLSMGYADLSKTSFFILDEADRMLDMGFFDDIMQIFSQLPRNVQVLLFSATMPPKIQKLAGNILKNPAEIKLAVSKPAEKIKQSCYVCYENQKLPILQSIFSQEQFRKVILFSSSKLKVKTLARELRKLNIKVGEMHSDLDQTKREDVMLDFKAGKLNVIVATDIISRGIDIEDIELVINYDVPRDPEDYVHRIGRTARADRDGRAVTFASNEDFIRLSRIERLLEKPIPKESVPENLGKAPEYGGCSKRIRINNSSKGKKNLTSVKKSSSGRGRSGNRNQGDEKSQTAVKRNLQTTVEMNRQPATEANAGMHEYVKVQTAVDRNIPPAVDTNKKKRRRYCRSNKNK